MKKVLAILLFAQICNVFAADTVFQSNFLQALDEEDPRARVDKIINALEVSSAPVCDINAVKLLYQEEKNGNISREQSKRLFALAKKKSGDFVLAELCVSLAGTQDPFPAELLDTVEKNILDADLKKLPKEHYDSALYIIEMYRFHRIFRGQQKQVNSFMDTLLAKYPDDLRLLGIAIRAAVHCCFSENFTTPGMADFNKRADSTHKQRLNMLGKKLLAMPVKEAGDAAIVVNSAIALHLPEAPALLKKYAKLYPSFNWRAISMAAAQSYKNPELLITYDEFFYDFQACLAAQDFPRAKKMLDLLRRTKIKKEVILELDLMLYLAAGENSRIVNAANAGKVNLNQPAFGDMTINTILTAAHIQQDKELIQTILKSENSKSGRTPSLDNALGYVCADLNIDLPAAEKLIRKAVKAEPYNPAYRDSLAWVLFKQGKLAEAEKEIDKAIRFCPASTSICVMMLHGAEIKYAMKKHDDAVMMLGLAALIYDPDDPVCSDYDLKAEKRLMRVLK